MTTITLLGDDMTGCGKQTEDVIDAFVAPLQVGLRIDILNSLEVVMRRFLLLSALALGTEGHFTIVSATGGLVGLHGEGTVTPGSAGAALLAYLRFDP